VKKILQTASLLFLMLASQSSIALDFLQALELAEKSDPEILAAEFEYQAMLETRAQSKSALLPTIQLSVFTSRAKQETKNSSQPAVIPDGSISFDTDGYSLSLSQSIYSHGLYKQLQQTDINIALSTAEINAQRQVLMLRVAEAYFLVLGSEDNLRFARAEKKAIGQQLEQTQKRFDVGLIAITDVKESQAQYDVSVAQQIDAQNKRAVNLESLRSLVGEMPASLKPLSVDMPLIIPQPNNMEKWVETGKQNNLSLQAAKLSYDVANKQIDINKSDHYPYLGLSVQHDYRSPDGGKLYSDSKDTSVSLQLTIPVYSGGLTSAKTRQAVLQAEQFRALRDKAYRQAIQEIRESYLGVTTSIAQVKAFKQSLISTQAAHEATQAGFEVGTRTAVDVLASLREQFRSERDYAKSRYTYVLNLLKLKSAAGILSKQDVVQVNRWLKF